MTLFRLDASILPTTSASRALGDIVQAQWSAAHPDSDIVRRDLAVTAVPASAWQNAVTAGFVPESERTPAQVEGTALASVLADELLAADALLLTVPLYNYGVSQHFKAWFDLVHTDPRIGGLSTALAGRPATLVTCLGGNYDPGSPKEGWDHSTPWLRRVLEDVWQLDLRVVRRSFTLVGVKPELDAFTEQAAELRAAAEADARRLGQDMAQARACHPVA